MDSNILIGSLLSSFNNIFVLDIINDKTYEYYIENGELKLKFSTNFLSFVDDRKKTVHPEDINNYFESISMKKLETSISNGNNSILYKYRLKDTTGVYKNFINIVRLVNYNNNKLILVLTIDSNELQNQNIISNASTSDSLVQSKLNDMVDTVSDTILKIYNSINMSNIDNANSKNTYVYNYITTLLDQVNQKYPEFNKVYEKNLISQVNKTKDIVLIVDDDMMTRTLLKKAFDTDYEIVTATNGKEAIDILENPNGPINSIDDINAIFLDIAMPVMDGFGVLDYLRTNNILRKIPVVIISAAEEKSTRDRVYKYNVADMLEKPFNMEVIKYRTKNFINLYKTSNSLNQLILGKNMELINTIETLSKSGDTNTFKYIDMLFNQVIEDNKTINLSSRNFKNNVPLHVEVSILIVEYMKLLNEGNDKIAIFNTISKKENTEYSSTVIDSFRKIIDKF